MALLLKTGDKLSEYAHPRFASQRTMRGFWRSSDRSRHDYANGMDASGHQILPRHEREKPDRYARRLAQAQAKKYAGPIIDRYADHVCRVPATRPEAADSTPYSLLLLDADGAGTPLPKFMRRAVRKAQVDGISYILTDSNLQGVYLTAAAEADAGKRPILRLVDADQVLYWRDWQGHVTEGLIVFCAEDGSEFAWLVDAKNTQRIELIRKKNDPELYVGAIDPPQPHAYGGCPLVRVCPLFTDEDEAGEDSQIAPLSESQKRICNLDSWHMEELQYGTFTTPVFLGISATDMSQTDIGPGMGLCLPGDHVSLAKLGADPAQAQSLRDSLDREVKELYRIAGLSPGNPTESGAPESGVAKAFSFNEVEAKLAAIADAGEMAENLAMQRLAAGFGFTYPGDADWPDKFDAPDLAAQLDLVIRTVTSTLPQVLKRAAIEDYAQDLALTGEQKQTLTEQLDAADVQAESAQTDPFMQPAPKPGAVVPT